MRAMAGAQPATLNPDIRECGTVGSYRLIRELGRGSMGTVFEAVHDRIGRRAAVKILDARLLDNPQALSRFLNEARAVNLIQHPGIVEVYDCIESPKGPAAIVMELVPGQPLSQLLTRGPLDVDDAVDIAGQIAEAISAAHGSGVVHRDLKPENIMVLPESGRSRRPRIKILDFGLAKMAAAGTSEADPSWQVQTRVTTLLGTPLYMAPEQCKGAGGVGAQADVYALGVMLYQMLAGAPPFNATGAGELLAMHIYATPPPLRVLPGTLAGLVHGMLAKSPADRPTMPRVCEGLQAVAQERAWGATSAYSVAAPDEDALPGDKTTVGPAPAGSEETAIQRLSAGSEQTPGLDLSRSAEVAVTKPLPQEGLQLSPAVVGAGPSLTLWCEEGTPPEPVALPVAAPTPQRRHPARWAWAAGCIVLLGAGIWFATRARQAGEGRVTEGAVAARPIATPVAAPIAAPVAVPVAVQPRPLPVTARPALASPPAATSIQRSTPRRSRPVKTNADVEILP